MGCLNGCRKWTVLFLNIFFLLIGILLITIGGIFNDYLSKVTEAIPSSYSYLGCVPIVTIVIGCIIATISISGSCAVCRKNSFLLTSHSFILLTIFVMEMAIGIFIFVEISNRNDFELNVNKTLDNVFLKQPQDNKELTDILQNKFDCCGTYGPNYWNEKHHTDPPKSCYIEEESIKVLYQSGCQREFYDFLLKTFRVCGVTILALSIFQVIGAIFTFSLANHIRNNIRRYGRYVK